MRSFPILVLFALLLFANITLAQKVIKPFQTHNLSPLVHFFCIPTNPGGTVLGWHKFSFGNYLNIANNATSSLANNEAIYLDGEMYRNELVLTYGLLSNLEVGIQIPMVCHSAGIMDPLIRGWHETFNLQGRAREYMEEYSLSYFFTENDQTVFEMDDSKLSLGDISFSAAVGIVKKQFHHLALRPFLKLSTGNKNNLVGSGTSDYGLQLTGTLNPKPRKKQFSCFYSVGFLRIGKGALLKDKISRNVRFGSLGFAFNANNKCYIKTQFDIHSSLYEKSYTKQLGKTSAQLIMGLNYYLSEQLSISGAFAEDIIVNTAPDFVLQFGISYQFK